MLANATTIAEWKVFCNAEKEKALLVGHNENDQGRSKNASLEICPVLQPDKNL